MANRWGNNGNFETLVFKNLSKITAHGEAWCAAVCCVAKSQTGLSDLTELKQITDIGYSDSSYFVLFENILNNLSFFLFLCV